MAFRHTYISNSNLGIAGLLWSDMRVSALLHFKSDTVDSNRFLYAVHCARRLQNVFVRQSMARLRGSNKFNDIIPI